MPSQESYGGIGRATGQAVRGRAPGALPHGAHIGVHQRLTQLALRAQKNSTFASMEGYTLEGTKKTGMSVKTKRNVLAAVKKAATESSAPAKAAPKKK